VYELGEERRKKHSSDRIIEKSVELFGYTPDEKSDKNLEWMREHGYLKKQKKERHQRSGI
jgi:hypothetical protein